MRDKCGVGSRSHLEDSSWLLQPTTKLSRNYMMTPRFCCGSGAPEPPVPSKPPKSTENQQCRLHLPRASRGVAPRTFLLGCDRVGHMNIRNPIWPHVITWCCPFRTKLEFPLRRAEPSYGISVVCEAGHTSETPVGSYNLPPNSHEYYMTTPRFCCGSRALEPPVPSKPPQVY